MFNTSLLYEADTFFILYTSDSKLRNTSVLKNGI